MYLLLKSQIHAKPTLCTDTFPLFQRLFYQWPQWHKEQWGFTRNTWNAGSKLKCLHLVPWVGIWCITNSLENLLTSRAIMTLVFIIEITSDVGEKPLSLRVVNIRQTPTAIPGSTVTSQQRRGGQRRRAPSSAGTRPRPGTVSQTRMRTILSFFFFFNFRRGKELQKII